MKNIKYIFICLFVVSITQAQIIKPLSCYQTDTQNRFPTSNIPLSQRVYYKDVNNYFTSFVGSWKHVEGNKTFIVTLYKRNMEHRYENDYIIYYIDRIYGHYKLVENYGLPNETEIYNSQDFTGDRPFEIFAYSPSTTATNLECTIYDVVDSNFPDKYFEGDLILTINSGTSPLTAQWVVTPIIDKWYVEGQRTSFVIPTNITLTKM